jgi:hypothetical protein
LTIAKCLYQNKIDVTEHIDFHWIAENHNLSEQECENLINDTQATAEIAIKNFFKGDKQ